ncbi:hypothetical protein ACMFMG_009316 [Clarireedia jacksonii]
MKKFYRKLSSKLSSRNLGIQSDNATIISPAVVPSSDPSAVGLKILHDEENADIDIIALHGQNGHPVDSWTERETKVLWLRDLLPREFGGVNKVDYQRGETMRDEKQRKDAEGVEIQDGFGMEASRAGKSGAERKKFKFRVLSYGYGGTEKVEKVCAGLVRGVESVRTGKESERKIIWIAHSFGGPLLKAAISTLPFASPLLTATQAILFFGVAQNMGFESLSMVEGLPDDVLSEEMRELRREGLWLRKGAEEFEKLEKGKNWGVIWFREIGEGGGKVQAGMEGKGKIESGVEYGKVKEVGKEEEERKDVVIRLNKTHGAMVRFASRQDEDFRKVVKCLKRILEGE